MPGAVVRPPAVHIHAVAELHWDGLLVLATESEVRLHQRCIFETNFARYDVVEFRTRIIAERIEIAERSGRIDFVKGFQHRGLARFIRADQNRLRIFDIEQAGIANTPVLPNSRFL